MDEPLGIHWKTVELVCAGRDHMGFMCAVSLPDDEWFMVPEPLVGDLMMRQHFVAEVSKTHCVMRILP